jgi:hypothetical protein
MEMSSFVSYFTTKTQIIGNQDLRYIFARIKGEEERRERRAGNAKEPPKIGGETMHRVCAS